MPISGYIFQAQQRLANSKEKHGTNRTDANT